MTRHAISRTIARISPLLFLFVFPCMLSAQTFYDDFSDGSAADGSPVTWTPYPETTMGVKDGDLIVSGNLRVSDSVNNFSLSVSGVSLTDPMFSDVSARVQARALQGTALKLGVRASSSAANADQYLVGIATGGGVALEKIINGVWQVFEIAWDTGLEPSNEDVVLQIDAIGDTLSVWAWRPSEPMPTEPLITAQDSEFSEGIVSFDVSNHLVNREVSAVVRYIQVDTKHIPEPSSLSLVLTGLLGLLPFRTRR